MRPSAQWLAAVVSALPALDLARRAAAGGLGVNPVEALTHESGDWCLRLLLACLCVSPLRHLTGANWVISYRRTLGLASFAYAVLHVLTFAVFDHGLDLNEMWVDVMKRPYITAGTAGLACLAPLALTSTRGWIRRLGRAWRRLHRLVYVAAVAGVIHFWWLVKADTRAPLRYAVVLALLLLARLPLQDFIGSGRRR